MVTADAPAVAACIAEAARYYRTDAEAVVAHVMSRGGRSGEVRRLPNGDVELGLARIPGREVQALRSHGITEVALANDDCLNVSIAAYLLKRDERVASTGVGEPRLRGGEACTASAAQRYHLPAEVLRAVVATEGGWDGLKKRNRNGSYDLGVAQINTIHLAELARYGVSEQQLVHDACVNVHVAAYRLRFEINRAGEFWRGVGNYHSRTPERSRAYQGRVRGNLDRLRAKP